MELKMELNSNLCRANLMALITNPLSVIKDVRVVLSMLLLVVMLPKLQSGFKFIQLESSFVTLCYYAYVKLICNRVSYHRVTYVELHIRPMLSSKFF